MRGRPLFNSQMYILPDASQRDRLGYLAFACESLLEFDHSHKKRKDGQEGGLVQVLFAAEPGFLKILVPRLPQNTSNVNIEGTGKSK